MTDDFQEWRILCRHVDGSPRPTDRVIAFCDCLEGVQYRRLQNLYSPGDIVETGYFSGPAHDPEPDPDKRLKMYCRILAAATPGETRKIDSLLRQYWPNRKVAPGRWYRVIED